MPVIIQNIFLALSHAVVDQPQDLVISGRNEYLLKRLERLFVELPRYLRWALFLGLYAFDFGVVFFGFGVTRFVHLNAVKQRKYALVWMQHRYSFIREAFKGFRGVLLLCYFSHPDVWRYIGYDPESHAQEKISKRQQLLKAGFDDS